MELTVYIPTRGRVGHTQQITLRDMQQFSTVKPWIVCPPDETARHRYYHDQVIPCLCDGIGPTRQWIIEQCPTQGVVMLDDDQYFSYRPDPEWGGAGALERIQNLDPMFQWISDRLDEGYPHGGISARQGNQNIEKRSAQCIRVNNSHFFDRDLYLSEQMRFDATPVMEDFFVTLTLLLRGYPNSVSYEYCWSQRGSGTKGGCSIYRTAEVQASAAELLAVIFPSYVRVVEKESASQSGVMAKRKDVNISWLKAWADRDPSTRLNKDYMVATPDLARR